MAKEFTKKLTNKGAAIRYQMDRGMTNAQISKFRNKLLDIIGKDQIF